MLVRKWKLCKNKKGITLLEMLAAVAITAILASVLSMMIVPITNTYRNASAKTELQQTVTARLNDIAMHLRGATGVYLSSSTGSFPDTNQSSDHRYQREGAKNFDAIWGIAMDNYYEVNNYNYSDGTKGKISGYRFPELKWTDYSDVDKPVAHYASEYTPSQKLASDIYQTADIYCKEDKQDDANKDLYFYVRKNVDGNNKGNALEVHLRMRKGNVVYEGTKTFVCENLMINGKDIYTAKFDKDDSGKWKLTKATVSTGSDSSKWTKYYSVWFSREI